jgi:hypothetical protein
MTSNPREETGYTPITRNEKRVPISDFGKAAKADIAKKKFKELLRQLQLESEQLNNNQRG